MNKTYLVLGTTLALAIAGCGDNSTPATKPVSASTSGDNSAAMKATADKLIADVTQYIKDNKWDLADKGMAQLVEMKPKLDPSYGPKIDQLKSMYDTAKAAAAKMPAMPKAP